MKLNSAASPASPRPRAPERPDDGDEKASPAASAFAEAVQRAETGDLLASTLLFLTARHLGAPNTIVGLGLAARKCGQPAFALDVLRIAHASSQPRGSIAYAHLLLSTGRIEDAESTLREALLEGPDPEVHQALSATAWLLGDVVGTCRHRREAERLGWPRRPPDRVGTPPVCPEVTLLELLP